MSDLALRRLRYREWLESHAKAQFGFAGEIAALAGRVTKGVGNETPPVELWANIVPTIGLVEMVRREFGPTTIHSAYRAPAYNAVIGGEKNSMHMQNRAIDFACANGTPAQWSEFLHAKRRDGAFKGGIGVYKTFVHVDTRGTNADWTG